MKTSFLMSGLVLFCLIMPWSRPVDAHGPDAEKGVGSKGAKVIAPKTPLREVLLSNIRQVTLAGKRAGEGYFSPNGRLMIFQSERQPGNPFYQMYVMNRDTGNVRRISPGQGKTTCGWLHPRQQKALFASTHADPKALDKQRAENEFRASGKKKRYSWDYDENYEIWQVDFATGAYKNLTNAKGYDAEGAYSPDGRQIVFASNRAGYEGKLSEAEQKLFDQNKSHMMDLYIMNADGSNVRRLTNMPGYDGGPFFSADGRKIVWRRFAQSGRTAEVFTMNVDGSDKRQITHEGLMSWAPFFHPSGDYIIYASNRFGHRNFELFIIDAEGKRDPVRVTTFKGFDALASFTPDGRSLAWTSKRSSDNSSQIFMASWDDKKARELLALDPVSSVKEAKPAIEECGVCKARMARLRWHVATLASDKMEGRLTGTPGERLATDYVANIFRLLKLEPAGDNGTYFQPFTFTSGVSLGEGNSLDLSTPELKIQETVKSDRNAAPLNEKDKTGKPKEEAGTRLDQGLKVDRDWRPLSFSVDGEIEKAPVVFAGFGLEAPAKNGFAKVDSYEGADVKGKWVLVYRGIPSDVPPKQRLHLRRFADLQYKASVARAKGAKGLIVAPEPGASYRDELVRLRLDAVGGRSDLAALSITRKLYQRLTAPFGDSFKQMVTALNMGETMRPAQIPGVTLSARISLKREQRTGRNVIARLKASIAKGQAAKPVVMIGAHVDHLGRGNVSGSLARENEQGQVHFGADDNASGVAALLELAERLSGQAKAGYFRPKRDILFAAWSGEELGLLGSKHFVNTLSRQTGMKKLSPIISAYLNMDMVGRLDQKLTLQGYGSSSTWPHVVERANILAELELKLSHNSYVPTDATSLYLAGVPVLHAYTGAHEDYSTPRDTVDKINYRGLSKIATLMDDIVRQLAQSERAPDYLAQKRPARNGARRRAGVFLGTIPDYASKPVPGQTGVKLSGVMKGGPAEQAGLAAGDVITSLGEVPIGNIYDYVRAINMLKVGEATPVTVLRDSARHDLTLTPAPKE